MTTENTTSAQTFRRLHEGGLLVLPNAWDAGTARLIESLGAKAIATSSAGVAWSHGYADGDLLPVPKLLATVEEIVRVVRVPVTVDVEGGYSAEADAVADVVARGLEAGAVGINIEDGAGSPDVLSAKIERAKEAAARLGVDLFVNARTDVYLRSLAPPERRIEECLARAERYRGAGADGIFVPGITDAAEIREIAAAARLPLNVLARPGLPRATELEALGVRRLSAGSGVAQAVYGQISALASEFLRDGASPPLSEGAMAYARINALIDRR